MTIAHSKKPSSHLTHLTSLSLLGLYTIFLAYVTFFWSLAYGVVRSFLPIMRRRSLHARLSKWRCSQARRGRDPYAGRGPHAGFGALAYVPTARPLGAARQSNRSWGLLKMVPLLLLLFPDTATALVRDVELVAPHSVELLAVGGAATAVALYYGGLGMADNPKRRKVQTTLSGMFSTGQWAMALPNDEELGAGTCASTSPLGPCGPAHAKCTSQPASL